jgi:hypothetical protein
MFYLNLPRPERIAIYCSISGWRNRKIFYYYWNGRAYAEEVEAAVFGHLINSLKDQKEVQKNLSCSLIKRRAGMEFSKSERWIFEKNWRRWIPSSGPC